MSFVACSSEEPGSRCGDGKCVSTESAESCPQDCTACSDVDSDGICEENDNCPNVANSSQNDIDRDGMGDACDPCPVDILNDGDGDGLCRGEDNCPDVYNVSQIDSDNDGLGNACDVCPTEAGGDADGDELCDAVDNCPEDYNLDQDDRDGDGLGDSCDPCLNDPSNDLDGDGVCDSEDLCRGGDDSIDDNGNGLPDACEGCDFVEERFVAISYQNVSGYYGEGPFTFQVVLFEDGDIHFNYDSMHNQVGPIVGLELPGYEVAIPYQFATINLPDHATLRFERHDNDYMVEDSLDLSGPPYEWLEGEIIDSLTLGDDDSASLVLPFRFPVAGDWVTAMEISSNGYLFAGGVPDVDCCVPGGQAIPTGRLWHFALMPMWFDLNPSSGGDIVLMQGSRTCEADCDGVWDGNARVDDCDVCAGGTTGLRRNFDKDCQGSCFGPAFLDVCGVCSGGTTNHLPGSDDVGCGCFEPPATLFYPDVDGDELGDPEGLPIDVCRLEAPLGYVDNMDDLEPECPTNDTIECGGCGARDCTDQCNGGAVIDPCGVCAGGATELEPASDEDLDGDGIADACSAPDLVIDQDYMRDTLYLDYLYVDPSDCYIEERCVTGSGVRKLVRFGTRISNLGTQDLSIGIPGGDAWTYASCHDHYHFADYAYYELVTNSGRQVAMTGNKNGWCVMDLQEADGTSRCDRYTCQDQGISRGCADIYSASLDCQWVDITGVPDGDYRVRVTTNPYRSFNELSFENNVAEVGIQIAGDSVTLLD